MTADASHRIEVIGLGPGDPLLRTLGAQRALDQAARIVLRTARHPGLGDLLGDPRVVTCDDLYEAGDTFGQVYDAVARRVCDLAEEAAGVVVYAVPGHPWFGERTVALLQAEAGQRGIEVNVSPAVSAFDAIASTLVVDLMAAEAQIVDAAELVLIHEQEPFAAGRVTIDPSRSALVCQVYAQSVASAVKLLLGRLYPDDHPVIIVRAAGVPGQQSCEQCRLFELDRLPVDHLTSVYVPALPPLEATRSPFTLQRIVAQLRAPGGCPWDRKQTHQSLRDAIIEEAYETVDAIDASDISQLAEELGDLLLIVAMHAQIAEEAGDFAIEDVHDAVSSKLVRRHPHVFGDVRAETPEAVVATWDAVKAAERAASSEGTVTKPPSPFEKLPRSMPALQKARALYGARKGSTPVAVDPDLQLELGESLLATARRASEAGVDPEQALADALERAFSGSDDQQTH